MRGLPWRRTHPQRCRWQRRGRRRSRGVPNSTAVGDGTGCAAFPGGAPTPKAGGGSDAGVAAPAASPTPRLSVTARGARPSLVARPIPKAGGGSDAGVAAPATPPTPRLSVTARGAPATARVANTNEYRRAPVALFMSDMRCWVLPSAVNKAISLIHFEGRDKRPQLVLAWKSSRRSRLPGTARYHKWKSVAELPRISISRRITGPCRRHPPVITFLRNGYRGGSCKPPREACDFREVISNQVF